MEFIQDLIIVQVREVTLNYDYDTHKTTSYQEIEVRAPGFGETWEVEHLGQISYFYDINYMFALASQLRKHLGYDKSTLFAAPYDFRKAPSKLT